MTSRTGNVRPETSASRGFTLVELMLVMAMLLIVVSLASPSLARFFRGRNLDAEVRRFITLTRYGQSRAVSEGIPMILWIDREQKVYGLQTEVSYDEDDSKAVEFDLNERLTLEVESSEVHGAFAPSLSRPQVLGDSPVIRFSPEGFISDTSPERIVIRETDGSEVWIVRSRNRLSYEVQTNLLETARR